jgi:hypothetical protein
MQVDNDHEQNDPSLPFADNDEGPDLPVLDGPLPLAIVKVELLNLASGLRRNW